jgi:hypothetical protein
LISVTYLVKIASKWFKNLNISPETLELLEESMQETFQDIGAGKAHKIKVKIYKCGYVKLKTLWQKKQSTE